MPHFEFQLVVVQQTLECGASLVEALFWPNFLRYANYVDRAQDSLARSIASAIPDEPREGLSRHASVDGVTVGNATVVLTPPRKSVEWRKAVEMRFQTVEWVQGPDARIIYVPALGIEVIGRPNDDLTESLESNIRLALKLKKASTLGKLLWLQRVQSVALDRQKIAVTLKSPKQVAKGASAAENEQKQSVLKQVGSNLGKRKLAEAYERGDVVARLAETLGGTTPRSVLLVGPSGVGKTAIVYETIRRRAALGFGETEFWETSGSRLVAGMSGFGMWQERCQHLWIEASKRRAVLYLGNLVELMDVGRSVNDSQGIASFLRPYIQRGSVQAIVECTPEQISVVERQEPRLLDAFSRIDVPEPTLDQGRAILANVAHAMNATSAIDLQGLDALDRLHRRYATYSVYPGRPVRFLKHLLLDREQGASLTAASVIEAFANQTGLPRFLLDETVPLDLDAAHEWFSGRVIGQTDAVDLVVSVLATVKAGLARPRRPIASLLFIGPTGVGKTEMAKSLAEFLFRNRDRMVRFDMSEFADPLAVERLIGGGFGTEGLLTGKVREQPFSVVLLDEVEKAHPSFFDLLLQILGEGRLTDGAGRLADFCNSVVIMTSNLGAESYRAGTAGFREKPASDAVRHFTNEVRAYLRPELFNRIDRIVPFAPLDEETVYKIARREVEQLKTRDGVLYRRLTLDIPNEVVGHLASVGYDVRYGARPLKRAIERDLLVPLAGQLNLHSNDVALTAEVRVDGHSLAVVVQRRLDENGRPVPATVADLTIADLSRRTAAFRRSVQKLEASSATRELQNSIYRLSHLEERFKHKVWGQDATRERVRRLPEMRRVAEGVLSLVERAGALEDDAVMALFGRGALDRARAENLLAGARDEWKSLVMRLHALQFERPDFVTIAIYGERSDSVFDLAVAYVEAAAQADLGVARIVRRAEVGPKGETVECQLVEKRDEFLASRPQGTLGIVVSVAGKMAFPRFTGERGVHLFKIGDQIARCLIQTAESPIADYKPIQGLERKGTLATYVANVHDVRRQYDLVLEEFVDFGLDRQRYYWNGRVFADALGPAIEEKLWRNAMAMLE